MLPRLMCLVSAQDDLGLLPALVEAGVDGFQVRDKVLGGGALVALTRRVLALAAAAGTGVTVVVNDRLDVALAAGAHGVHLGAEDLAVADARRLAPDLLIGATCRSAADVLAARRAGADYAGVGPVFATGSKTGLPAPMGTVGLGSATAAGLPVLGIGGIEPSNVAGVVAAGAQGVAVIGGIWRAGDPVEAARRIAESVAC